MPRIVDQPVRQGESRSTLSIRESYGFRKPELLMGNKLFLRKIRDKLNSNSGVDQKRAVIDILVRSSRDHGDLAAYSYALKRRGMIQAPHSVEYLVIKKET
jgi:hypothetical protein